MQLYNSRFRFGAAILFIVGAVLLTAPAASAEQPSPGREFIMSCTYGVMAGTLVGAATLAFSSSPASNLQNVARGASIGLYLGIALGYYTAYLLPKQIEQQQQNLINSETNGSVSSDDFQFFPFLAYDRMNHTERPGLGFSWQF